MGEIQKYWGITVRQDNCHDKAQMKCSKHNEMKRVATKDMSYCLSKKKVENLYI